MMLFKRDEKTFFFSFLLGKIITFFAGRLISAEQIEFKTELFIHIPKNRQNTVEKQGNKNHFRVS